MQPFLAYAASIEIGGPFGTAGVREFHLPEISPDERIRYNGQKIRKHHTKRRRNKLHDKRR
jgi:hypothetical protein